MAADQDAAAQREADLKAAAARLAAQRKAEDEATASRRTAEDEELADRRTAEDRALASAINRVNVASAALGAAVDAGDLPAVRAAHAELAAAVADHLAAAPEPPPADPAEQP